MYLSDMKTFSFVGEAAQMKQIQELAVKQERSTSFIIRKALQKYVAAGQELVQEDLQAGSYMMDKK